MSSPQGLGDKGGGYPERLALDYLSPPALPGRSPFSPEDVSAHSPAYADLYSQSQPASHLSSPSDNGTSALAHSFPPLSVASPKRSLSPGRSRRSSDPDPLTHVGSSLSELSDPENLNNSLDSWHYEKGDTDSYDSADDSTEPARDGTEPAAYTLMEDQAGDEHSPTGGESRHQTVTDGSQQPTERTGDSDASESETEEEDGSAQGSVRGRLAISQRNTP